MTAHAPENDLADWVRSILAQGICLEVELLACLEGTFGTSDPEVLLAEAESSEVASFWELIFTPDAMVRRAYEARWGRHAFSEAAARTVEKSLAGRPVPSALHVPGRKGPLPLAAVPEFALAAFVQRLNITWQPSQALDAVLARRLEGAGLSQVRALLRHGRVQWQLHRVEFLDRFLAHITPDADDFETDLDFACALLNELEPDQAPFDFLMAKKRFYFQALCKAQAFEQRLQAGNMEILMLQGARAAYGDVAQWRAWMRQVDRISTALFGSTQYFQEPRVVGLGPDE